MTTVFVDVMEIDRELPGGKFTIALGEFVPREGLPTLVPSTVELQVRDGKGEVDVEPGRYRVTPTVGCSSGPGWEIQVPAEGSTICLSSLVYRLRISRRRCGRNSRSVSRSWRTPRWLTLPRWKSG